MDVTREGHRDAPLILIVDDEADIADMLESYFRLEGYRTLVARDAAGAIEAAGRASASPPSRARTSTSWPSSPADRGRSSTAT